MGQCPISDVAYRYRPSFEEINDLFLEKLDAAIQFPMY